MVNPVVKPTCCICDRICSYVDCTRLTKGNGIERVMKVLKQTAAREEDFVFSSLCESCDYQLAILEQAQIIQSFVEREFNKRRMRRIKQEGSRKVFAVTTLEAHMDPDDEGMISADVPEHDYAHALSDPPESSTSAGVDNDASPQYLVNQRCYKSPQKGATMKTSQRSSYGRKMVTGMNATSRSERENINVTSPNPRSLLQKKSLYARGTRPTKETNQSSLDNRLSREIDMSQQSADDQLSEIIQAAQQLEQEMHPSRDDVTLCDNLPLSDDVFTVSVSNPDQSNSRVHVTDTRNRDDTMGFKVGMMFLTWPEFESRKKAYCDRNSICMSLDASHKMKTDSFDEVLRPYQRVRYFCLFGKKRASRGQGKVHRLTLRQSCPFILQVRYDSKKSAYLVTKAYLQHNHVCDPDDLPKTKRNSKKREELKQQKRAMKEDPGGLDSYVGD